MVPHPNYSAPSTLRAYGKAQEELIRHVQEISVNLPPAYLLQIMIRMVAQGAVNHGLEDQILAQLHTEILEASEDQMEETRGMTIN